MTRFDLQTIAGSRIKPYIRDLASLRITVFREYPHLYDGNIEYEEVAEKGRPVRDNSRRLVAPKSM